MDAPDAAWFARQTGPGEDEWTGEGYVLTADYHTFYLLNDDIEHVPEVSESVAWASPEGSVIFSTVRRYGPVIVQIAQVASAPKVTGAEVGWDATASFILPVVDDTFLLHSPFGEPSYDIRVPPGDQHVLVRRALVGTDMGDNADDYFKVTEPPYELFLVQLWPTGGTSESDRLRKLRADRDSDASAAEAQRSEAAAQRAEAARGTELWGELDPPADLEALGPEAAQVTRASYELAVGVARADPPAARRLAAWAVEAVAAEIDGTLPVDLTPAVDAIRSGSPLPPPFDDIGMAFKAMLPDAAESALGSFTFGPPAPAPEPRQIAAPAATCAAICATDVATPNAAAMAALNDAASGFVDKAAFWRRAEAAFEQLR